MSALDSFRFPALLPQRVRPWALAAAIAGAVGCAHRSPPPAPPVALPPAFAAATGERAPAPRWWEEIGDPALNALLDEALRGSLDLARARARLELAEAAASAAGAERAPQITLEGGARRVRALATGGPNAGEPVHANTFSLGLAAAYEFDLWDRVGSTARAARREAEASRDDLATARLTLAGEIAEAWLQAREQAAQLALLETQRRAARDFLELTEQRFAEGHAAALDVLQQRQQLAAIEAQIPPVEARYRVLRHQIAVLAGRAPSAAPEPPPGLPELTPPPAAGVPGDVLERRPDVRAALARLAAADERIGAAAAARLPAIRFSGNAGYQAGEASALFDEWIGSLAGNVALPLLDGGRRAAETRRARAAAREAMAAAGQTILRALREVEDALAQEERQREAVRRLAAQAKLAAETLAQARERYAAGLSDYLTVLTALDRLQGVERSLLAARRQAWQHRIQLYRALGGEPFAPVAGKGEP